MIISKLTGGLGNQLFQYAKGRSEATKNRTSLALDISWYKGRIDRSYYLNNFNITAKIASKLEIIIYKYFNKKNYIVGDWQSEKYFNDISDLIKKEFVLKNQIDKAHDELIQQIKSTDSISIHLRGGDYVVGKKSSFHGICSPEYYSKSISYIIKNVKFPHFFIFTDDINWAKKHIKFPEPYTLVSNSKNKPYEEIIFMSKCKHNIIANSTFSWWSAWLNNNPTKIVIAPKRWFANDKIDSSDIIPLSWIKM